jgi:hypothetical protein
MADPFPQEDLTQALGVLAAEPDGDAVTTALSSALTNATLCSEPSGQYLRVGDHPVAFRSLLGSLTFFLPPSLLSGRSRRLASFDRHGRLLLLIHWDRESGRLSHFKARGVDGRFLGVVRGAASHLGWGESDGVWLLDGEEGFALDRSLTLFRSVAYEDLDFLPPLDNPTMLPAGGGSTVLNVLALLAQDQAKSVLRYRGPYPSERLFTTLRESFRYSGEPGATRERFTQGAEEAALQLEMKEAEVDWRPAPHERFFPAAHTCVQLRDGIEKIYDRGRIYFRPDLAVDAQAIWLRQTEDGRPLYVAGLMMLGQALEAHLILDESGMIVERPPIRRDWDLRGGLQLSDDWKATLVRLIAAESSSLLRSALWPVMAELTFVWEPLRGRLWAIEGNEISLHAGMAAVYREALSRTKSAGESLLLAARFTSELARLIGPLLRERAQAQLAGLSPQDQQIALLFASAGTHGLSDNELRKFLTKLAQGEELPVVT